MTNPAPLAADTVLYCPAEPEGRTFPAGSPWPGDAWTAERGGKPIGGAAVAQAAKDLIAAQDTIDSLSGQLASKDHDLAQLAAQRDEATGKIADLEQRAIAAETAKTEADEAARAYMLERDQARADFKTATDKLDAAQTEAAKVADLVGQLETANQTIADLNDKLAAKPAKTAKAAAAPPAEGAEASDAT